MPAALTLLVLALAGGSLLASGVQKLGRPALVVQAGREVRLPAALTRPWIGTALPVLEILVGTGLLLATGGARVVAAACAILLHLAYLVAVTRVVYRRWSADCHCFGDLLDGSVTWRTVVRNGVLLAAAIASLVVPSDEPGAVAAGITAALILVASAVARDVAERRRPVADPTDTTVALAVQDVRGLPLPLPDFYSPPTVLVFFSASCGACGDLVPAFRTWPGRLPDDVDLQPVLQGSPGDFRDLPAFEPLVDHAWYDPDRSVANALGVVSWPSAVYVSADQPLGTGAALGQGAIVELLNSHGGRVGWAPSAPPAPGRSV